MSENCCSFFPGFLGGLELRHRNNRLVAVLCVVHGKLTAVDTAFLSDVILNKSSLQE